MSIPRTRRSRTFFPLILAGSLAALPCRASAQEDDGTDSGADTAARFEALDANHDGWITKAEAAKDPSVAYDDLLRVGDANHDGRLSRGEFESANNEILANGPGFARGDDQPEALFVQWDENRDDRLGPDEVPASAKPTLQRILDSLGRKDGPLTFEEFVGGYAKARNPAPATGSSAPAGN